MFHLLEPHLLRSLTVPSQRRVLRGVSASGLRESAFSYYWCCHNPVHALERYFSSSFSTSSLMRRVRCFAHFLLYLLFLGEENHSPSILKDFSRIYMGEITLNLKNCSVGWGITRFLFSKRQMKGSSLIQPVCLFCR